MHHDTLHLMKAIIGFAENIANLLTFVYPDQFAEPLESA